uniref:ATP synthase F0 subunit 8 n=1 Tax=Nanhaipotamon hongkongense TaxID=328652 RepID=A0A891GWG9_9EUCA|nr:ATP synthase F0 subunit 8 [Nanhaipotamon hongkongense]QRK27348.1 ATP synthase F0 subunit 8 [Nanhaipotamon hongkongense]
MPQMAPLLWLFMFIFFILSLMMFLILNYFIKPFKIYSFLNSSHNTPLPLWKL